MAPPFPGPSSTTRLALRGRDDTSAAVDGAWRPKFGSSEQSAPLNLHENSWGRSGIGLLVDNVTRWSPLEDQTRGSSWPVRSAGSHRGLRIANPTRVEVIAAQ